MKAVLSPGPTNLIILYLFWLSDSQIFDCPHRDFTKCLCFSQNNNKKDETRLIAGWLIKPKTHKISGLSGKSESGSPCRVNNHKDAAR